MVEITVDRCLRFQASDLPPGILREIRAALEFENVEKKRAKKEHQGGWWKMPDRIVMHKQLGKDRVELPRGFIDQLIQGLDHHGIEFSLKDDRREPEADYSEATEVSLRDYQVDAAASIIRREQGIWQAPPAAGKTVTVLEVIRRLGLRALVIVDKTNIAEQWRERAREHLGIEVGLIGDGVWEEKDLTIALQQTLWARREELEKQGFFDKWGFVCLDECHHLPARTFTDTVQRFSSQFRIGVSGTPAKQWHHLPLMEASIGDIFHRTNKDLLRKGGWLMTPKVILTDTSFEKLFWPTHRCDTKTGKCGYSFCTRDKAKVVHRNNYTEVIKELITDRERNMGIATQIAGALDEGRCCLVLSKRLGHLDELARITKALRSTTDGLYQFTGRQSTEERMEVQAIAEQGSCALFSTIADEALDIPRADTLFLAFPTRNTGTITQQIGRIERPHPDKFDPLVFDYRDPVGVFKAQLRDRMEDVYLAENLSVVSYTPEDG